MRNWELFRRFLLARGLSAEAVERYRDHVRGAERRMKMDLDDYCDLDPQARPRLPKSMDWRDPRWQRAAAGAALGAKAYAEFRRSLEEGVDWARRAPERSRLDLASLLRGRLGELERGLEVEEWRDKAPFAGEEAPGRRGSVVLFARGRDMARVVVQARLGVAGACDVAGLHEWMRGHARGILVAEGFDWTAFSEWQGLYDRVELWTWRLSAAFEVAIEDDCVDRPVGGYWPDGPTEAGW